MRCYGWHLWYLIIYHNYYGFLSAYLPTEIISYHYNIIIIIYIYIYRNEYSFYLFVLVAIFLALLQFWSVLILCCSLKPLLYIIIVVIFMNFLSAVVSSEICSYLTYDFNHNDRRWERMVSFKICQWGCCWKFEDPCCTAPWVKNLTIKRFNLISFHSVPCMTGFVEVFDVMCGSLWLAAVFDVMFGSLRLAAVFNVMCGSLRLAEVLT